MLIVRRLKTTALRGVFESITTSSTFGDFSTVLRTRHTFLREEATYPSEIALFKISSLNC